MCFFSTSIIYNETIRTLLNPIYEIWDSRERNSTWGRETRRLGGGGKDKKEDKFESIHLG